MQARYAMGCGVTLLITLLISVDAAAKFSATDAARIRGATTLRIADVFVTLAEYAQYPLPIAQCATWVRMATGDERIPDVLIRHTWRNGEWEISVSTPVHHVAAFRDVVASLRSVAVLPMVATSSITDRGCDVRVLLAMAEDVHDSITHEDLVRLIDTTYAEVAPPDIQYVCSDLPTWMARAYPVTFDRVVPADVLLKDVSWEQRYGRARDRVGFFGDRIGEIRQLAP
ncbi:hypothetical protein HY632_01845 [Candidatus Uhrbacteria bacterium]|nr:hypothetical protein [Candidatus Uhrbacteria bacterium]